VETLNPAPYNPVSHCLVWGSRTSSESLPCLVWDSHTFIESLPCLRFTHLLWVTALPCLGFTHLQWVTALSEVHTPPVSYCRLLQHNTEQEFSWCSEKRVLWYVLNNVRPSASTSVHIITCNKFCLTGDINSRTRNMWIDPRIYYNISNNSISTVSITVHLTNAHNYCHINQRSSSEPVCITVTPYKLQFMHSYDVKQAFTSNHMVFTVYHAWCIALIKES